MIVKLNWPLFKYFCKMNKRHHNNILLNLGIENLNEMQEAARNQS
jgi:hypothetical protein